MAQQRDASSRAFTLVELLVVIGIIALLIGLLFPALIAAQRAALLTVCGSNQRQIGIAIYAYAVDNKGCIPYGPTAPAATPTNFYPGTGDVTSLLSLQSGDPVGLGLLLNTYLTKDPHVLFCPAPDQPLDADAQLALVGYGQARGYYYYRHGSITKLSDPSPLPPPTHIHLADLGLNTGGNPVRALVMDENYLTLSSLAVFGVATQTNHRRRWVNVLYSDGHVATLDNSKDLYTIQPLIPTFSLNFILAAFESADTQ